jgi:hypothetical protein
MRTCITALSVAFLVICGRVEPANAQPVVPGSTAFCLYEVPLDDSGKRRWINLGIVQYVEATAKDVKLVYGGGAFGAGHDSKIPVASMDEALVVLEKLRRVAAACR